jgi:hypothetical protein
MLYIVVKEVCYRGVWAIQETKLFTNVASALLYSRDETEDERFTYFTKEGIDEC